MDFCELTTEYIDMISVARRVVPPECGATVTLDGYARRFTKDKVSGDVRETEYLEYEAYDEMALKEMRKLIEAAKQKFAISHVGIVHRLGRLEIGETSVITADRGESQFACRDINRRGRGSVGGGGHWASKSWS